MALCAGCGTMITGGFEGAIDCKECRRWFCDNCYDTSQGAGCHCHPASDYNGWTEDQLAAAVTAIFDGAWTCIDYILPEGPKQVGAWRANYLSNMNQIHGVKGVVDFMLHGFCINALGLSHRTLHDQALRSWVCQVDDHVRRITEGSNPPSRYQRGPVSFTDLGRQVAREWLGWLEQGTPKRQSGVPGDKFKVMIEKIRCIIGDAPWPDEPG